MMSAVLGVLLLLFLVRFDCFAFWDQSIDQQIYQTIDRSLGQSIDKFVDQTNELSMDRFILVAWIGDSIDCSIDCWMHLRGS